MCDVGGVIARYMKSRVKPEREIIYPDEIPVDRAGREMYNRYGDKLDIEDRE